jgi:hypothetical protein
VLETALQQLPTPIHAKIGRRDDNELHCVVIHGSLGDPSGSLGDRFADLAIPIQLTAVGESEQQALAYADAARAALLTVPLVVAGRTVQPPWQTASQPALRDEAVNPPLWIATAQYEIKSTPA